MNSVHRVARKRRAFMVAVLVSLGLAGAGWWLHRNLREKVVIEVASFVAFERDFLDRDLRGARFLLRNGSGEQFARPGNDAAFSRVKMENGWEDTPQPLPVRDRREGLSFWLPARGGPVTIHPDDALHFSVPFPQRNGAVTARPFQVGLKLRRIEDGKERLVWSEVVTP